MGPKKGVISQSVKDVVQSLVDDDLVLKDKIGSSVRIRYINEMIYFWHAYLITTLNSIIIHHDCLLLRINNQLLVYLYPE